VFRREAVDNNVIVLGSTCPGIELEIYQRHSRPAR